VRRDEFDALPLMLRVEDVMRALDTGRTATYEAIRAGEIPSFRIGRSVRVPKHRLADMLGLSENGVAAPPAQRHSEASDATTPEHNRPTQARPFGRRTPAARPPADRRTSRRTKA
jgi:excisionase family DNA binding protein